MQTAGIKIIFAITVLSIILGCERKPKNVIEPAKMEDLLVDVHKGEAFMESDYAYYREENRKDSVENAIFAKHGVTREIFDTSLVWYGLNIEKYIQMYGRVIERLQKEDNDILVLMNDDKDVIGGMTRSGDTINIWNRDPYYTFEGSVSRNLLSFSIPSDDNFRIGDKFKLKFKLYTLTDKTTIYSPRVILAVRNSLDSIDFVSKEIKYLGWDSLTITSNSMLRSVIGSIYVPSLPEWRTVYADSITLTRIHQSTEQQ